MAYYVYFMMLATFVMPWLLMPRTATVESGTVAAIAGNLLVQHQAAIAYARAHPGATGAVPPAQLAWPGAAAPSGPWVSVLDGAGGVATYSPLPLRGTTGGQLAAELAQVTGGAFGTGLSSGGSVRSARGTTLPLPAGVPDGVPVVVSSVGN
jgi:hypothetical protein